MAAADLSTCCSCGRAVPPATNPDFANWAVVKDDAGKVRGMACPGCKVAELAKDADGG
ncbi:MAG: hypothetical protein ACR2FZ_07435 [Thermoleophilaceae bacterium]